MAVFSSKDFDDHEAVIFHAEPESGLRAIIALHNTSRGPALGGCRMWPYATEDDAISDVLRLSRGMTYKSAIVELPYGGGKAVIIGDPRTQKTEALLRAMGRFVDSLNGRFYTGEDVGMTVADVDILRQETGRARGSSEDCGDPSPVTAYGVLAGIRAAVAHRRGGRSLAGLRVAVQGVGSVGYRLCRHLADEGAHLLVADIDAERVRRAVAEFGATAVAAEGIHRVKADIFSPCALGAVIDDRAVSELGAKIVAGAANNQLAEARHGAALKARGILYAPDYVINAGGLIDVALEGPDHDRQDVIRRVAGIFDTLAEIFRRADGENLPTGVIADRMAEARFHRPGHRPAVAA